MSKNIMSAIILAVLLLAGIVESGSGWIDKNYASTFYTSDGRYWHLNRGYWYEENEHVDAVGQIYPGFPVGILEVYVMDKLTELPVEGAKVEYKSLIYTIEDSRVSDSEGFCALGVADDDSWYNPGDNVFHSRRAGSRGSLRIRVQGYKVFKTEFEFACFSNPVDEPTDLFGLEYVGDAFANPDSDTAVIIVNVYIERID